MKKRTCNSLKRKETMISEKMLQVYEKARLDAACHNKNIKETAAYNLLNDWHNQMIAALVIAYTSYDEYSIIECLAISFVLSLAMYTWPPFFLGLCAGIMTPDNVGLLRGILSGIIWFAIFAAVAAASYELWVCTIGIFVMGKGLADLRSDYHKATTGELTVYKVI